MCSLRFMMRQVNCYYGIPVSACAYGRGANASGVTKGCRLSLPNYMGDSDLPDVGLEKARCPIKYVDEDFRRVCEVSKQEAQRRV
jgi:hypothetical protein